MNSIEGMDRARPAPFLQTRINARINNTRENITLAIRKPAIVISGLLMIILVNMTVLFVHRHARDNDFSKQTMSSGLEQEDISIANIYDIENITP